MTDLSMHDVQRSLRLRAVTDNLFFWQGLRFAPIGPAFLALGLAYAQPALPEAALGMLLITAVLVGTWFARQARLRYRREIGQVDPIKGAHNVRTFGKWMILYPIMFLALMVDVRLELPILLTALVWPAAILLYRHATGGGRWHYVVLAAALAPLAFAPLVVGLHGPPLISLFLMLFGAGATAAFILDDRELRSILRGA